jgi:1-acyl-sn-glycerol-3-phosphate acyltransferase
MTKQIAKKNYIDYYAVRFGGITAVLLVRLYLFITHSRTNNIELDRKIDKNEPTVIISNHQRLLDSPAIFSAVSLKTLYQFSPVKFMTWRRIYNSVAKPILYLTGCYSTHGEGKTGVYGAVTFARQGYRSFIYPEGKRQKDNKRTKAYRGIIDILEELPEARIILVNINWTKKQSRVSRNKLSVHMFEAPNNLDKTNPDAIMDAIYKGK